QGRVRGIHDSVAGFERDVARSSDHQGTIEGDSDSYLLGRIRHGTMQRLTVGVRPILRPRLAPRKHGANLGHRTSYTTTYRVPEPTSPDRWASAASGQRL